MSVIAKLFTAVVRVGDTHGGGGAVLGCVVLIAGDLSQWVGDLGESAMLVVLVEGGVKATVGLGGQVAEAVVFIRVA